MKIEMKTGKENLVNDFGAHLDESLLEKSLISMQECIFTDEDIKTFHELLSQMYPEYRAMMRKDLNE